MKNQQEWIEIHQKNRIWINQQIRICLLARRTLTNEPQKLFESLIQNSDSNNRPDLIPLRELTNNPYWAGRFRNYNLGIIGTIFNVHHFVYQARLLNYNEEEKPILLTPAC